MIQIEIQSHRKHLAVSFKFDLKLDTAELIASELQTELDLKSSVRTAIES